VSVSAILLAAGESTRMGRQKALLPWEGTTLLEYQLASLAEVEAIGEIIVVTGHEPERITEIASTALRTRVAHNANYRTGKVSSIHAGLAAVSESCTAILLLAIDQPRASEVIRDLVESHDTRGALITVPAYGGRRGHPVLFASAMRQELAAIREETQGIRALLQRNAGDISVVEFDDPAVLLDVNSAADVPPL
jgi:molybdenum cofactor cytidylyltransferase